MTTTNGLLAPAFGSFGHGRFSVRQTSPRIPAAEIAAIVAPKDARLAVAPTSGNSLAAATTIRAGQGRYAFGAAALEPADPAPAPTAPEISFGPFCLRPAQRLLLESGRVVAIGGRGLDLLIALVERAGELVMKDELMARVWPNVNVSEGSLKTQVFALRAALGDGRDGARYVVSIPGRGYCFVAPLTRSFVPRPPEPPAVSLEAPISPPVRPTGMIGRAGIVHELLRRMQRHRFVTIVGPVGIGKTAVASAVAEGLAAACNLSVCLVDLSQLSESSQVMGALASALGVATGAGEPIERVIASLRGAQKLIVLDCCDHVVDGAAVLAERMLEGSPDVRVLATSCEPLRAEGEAVCRLPALETPPDSDGLTAIEALNFPAIQLFVERVAWNIDDFELSDADAPVVADICRRLDGLPLAIELAAGHFQAFGARGLAAALGNRFRLLMRGRRTALRRHQTLGAALDWSYETLSEPERLILRRLSVFDGAFTLNDACAIAMDAAISAPEVAEIVANLVAKSLVNRLSTSYRLLETTGDYIREMVAQGGETPVNPPRAASSEDALGAPQKASVAIN